MKKNLIGIPAAIIKKDFETVKRQLVLIFFLLILFPLVLGYMYGIMYQNVLEQKIDLKTLEVLLFEDGSTTFAESFNFFLKSDMLSFISIKEFKSKAQLQNTLKSKPEAVGIIISGNKAEFLDEGKDSIGKSILLRNLSEFVSKTDEEMVILGKLSERYPLYRTYSDEISGISFVSELHLTGKRVLTTMEIFLLSVFIGFSFIASTDMLKEKENGLVLRALSTGISKMQLFSGNFISTFLLSFFMVIVYFLIALFLILRSSVSFQSFFPIIFIHAFFIASYQSLITGLFKTEKGGRALGIPLFIIFIYLGGSFYPVSESSPLWTVANFTPNFHLFKLYESVLLDTGLQGQAWRFAVLGISAAVLFLAGWASFMKKEVA